MTREEILRLFAVAKNRNITEKAKMKTIKASSWEDVPINFTGVVEWESGIKYWYKEGKYHREDGPAMEFSNGTRKWFKDGKYHREDGPAIEWAFGTKYWYLNGSEYTEKNWKLEIEKLEIEKLKEPKMKVLKLKNYENKPNNFTGIIEYPNGTKSWFKEGKWHREDGPAVEYPNGDKWWYKEGKRHREDGPACEFSNGTRKWYKESKLHREDGPAIEWAVGTKEWYLNGSEYSEENWKLEVEKLKINYWSEVPSNFTGIAEIAGEAKQWFKNGLWHREDGPAIEWANGTKYWCKEGKYHREDGPAIDSLNGHKEWYKNGKCHREDGPAVERLDGSKFWYKDDKLHREDGPAFEYSNGDKHWYKEGKLHREDGPAIEWASGDKEWWIDGKRHRDNGPAIEWANGDKEWWINHLRYSEEEWKFKVQELKSPKMETLKIKSSAEIPKNFTGIVEFPNGDKWWYKEGKRHRENGPAVEDSGGTKFWYKEGQLHREDGPACEYSSGHKEWWIKGKRVSKVENIPIESKLNAQKTRPSKSRQVAIRVASRQVIKSISALITNTLTKGFKASDSQKLNSWFKSEAGSAVLMVLVGKILPRFETVLPEEYKPLFSEIAEEIEIETMVDLTDGIIDSIAAAMVSFDFNSFQFFNSESEAAENVRVETLSAPTVTPWESVAVTPAVHSEIKTATT